MTQTEKETIYSAGFRRGLEDSIQPDWMKSLREEAFRFFTENGFPVVQSEEWKYTNVSPIAKENFRIAKSADFTKAETAPFVFAESSESVLVFANGMFDRSLSNLKAASGATILSFGEAASDERFAAILKSKLGSLVGFEKNGFTALNSAFIGEGAFIFLPKNARIETPIQLLFLTENDVISCPRILIVAENFAEATIIETYVRSSETKYLTNAVIEISIADEAKIKHYRVQRESHEAFHVSTAATEVARGSVYDTTAINLGAKLSRHDVALKFLERNSEAWLIRRKTVLRL